MERFIYADNAATTKISQPVLEAMMPYLTEQYGNPSSVYALGRESKKAIELARERVATALGADVHEIYFTGSGSESNNWAVKGCAQMMQKRGKGHIVTSAIEHHAVLHVCERLQKEGFEVTFLPVGENGIVDVQTAANAIREDTGLVTIMYANNEVGTIQPIAEIGALCRERGILFHTDAVQAVGNVEIDVKAQNIDMLSLSGHKLHAPKGVGALYIRKGIAFPGLIDGGGQERGRRAGTENVAGIVGLGTAAQAAAAGIAQRAEKVRLLRDELIDGLLKIEKVRLNGDKERRLAGNVNVSVAGIEGEALLLMLDMNGIAASSGSACTSGSLDPSHVLLAMGLEHEIAHGSLRLSLGENNTREDVEYILKVVPRIVDRLRDMSPTWERIVKEGA